MCVLWMWHTSVFSYALDFCIVGELCLEEERWGYRRCSLEEFKAFLSSLREIPTCTHLLELSAPIITHLVSFAFTIVKWGVHRERERSHGDMMSEALQLLVFGLISLILCDYGMDVFVADALLVAWRLSCSHSCAVRGHQDESRLAETLTLFHSSPVKGLRGTSSIWATLTVPYR